MKYVQRDMGAAADNSAARGSAFKELAKLTLMVLALILAIYFIVGFIVDMIAPRISVETEKKIFGSMRIQTMLESEKYDERVRQLEPILKKLAARSEVPPLDYQLFVMDYNEPNAVAVPGGAIGVTRGLLDIMEKDEVALAFVLGHELGHFKQRDHLRGLGRGIGLQICFAIVFGKRNAVNVLGRNVLNLLERKYSRKQEMAADRFGLFLVHKTYGSTEGTARLFEILQKKENLPGWAYMFATHPKSADRVKAMKKYAEELEKQENK